MGSLMRILIFFFYLFAVVVVGVVDFLLSAFALVSSAVLNFVRVLLTFHFGCVGWQLGSLVRWLRLSGPPRARASLSCAAIGS